MPEHRMWKFRIKHILEAIERIQDYMEGLSFESFLSDEKTVDAVIRKLEIIGEAVKHVPLEVQDKHPCIPWSIMSAMRNVLIHEYDRVSIVILWTTVKNDLPPLIRPLNLIYQEEVD